MVIEISEPELETMIRQQLESGRFKTVEEVLLKALQLFPAPAQPAKHLEVRTGADLIAALQACPYPDVDLEPARYEMPVSDPVEL